MTHSVDVHVPLKALKPFLGLVDRTAFLCERVAEKDVLHVGCADHPFTADRMSSEEFLHRRLTAAARSCLGLDLSETAVEMMKSAGITNVVQGDACRMSETLSTRFDVIVAGEVLEHLPNPSLFLAEAARCLRPSGLLLVTVPNAFNFPRLLGLLRNREVVHRDHCYYFSAKTLSLLARLQGFQLKELGYNDPLAQARHHLFLTPLWRLFIRRFPVFGQSVIASFTIGTKEEPSCGVIN
jgi:2-polyprenyl-3-methyl-5-hydroxy-6-metoxy-1,4-benzoquinol methylase